MNPQILKTLDQLNRDLAQKQEEVRTMEAKLRQAKQEIAQAKFALDNFMVQLQMTQKP